MELSPFVIVALGQPARPAERLIGLQSAIGRLVGWIAGLRLVRFPDRTATQAARILVKN